MNNQTITNIQILPVEEKHIEGFYKCFDYVAGERLYLALVEAPPFASFREIVRSNIAQDLPQFVAVNDKMVVGWCTISPKTIEGFFHRGSLNMGVYRDFRGYGLGMKLVAKTIDKAKETDLERIEVQVFASNKAAIELYQKTGFLVEGKKKKARKIDGVYDDIVQMALLM